MAIKSDDNKIPQNPLSLKILSYIDFVRFEEEVESIEMFKKLYVMYKKLIEGEKN